MRSRSRRCRRPGGRPPTLCRSTVGGYNRRRMFGSHLSIAGGMHRALLEAEKLGHGTVQVFTKNQQQWAAKPLEAAAVAAWAAERDRLGFGRAVSHDSYLINLATADEVLWRKSIDAFADELTRCAALGIPLLVTHPGAHVGAGEADVVHDRVPVGVVTCLESTAGQGSTLGYKLEHLGEIIAAVKEPDRLGVCLDTAHLFAAGYDFRGRKYAGFRKRLDAAVGVGRVRVLHLNDSKKELGSRVDRHEHIGLGTIGVEGFKPFVRDRAFADLPKIMETPKGKDEQGREWDAVNLEVLRELM